MKTFFHQITIDHPDLIMQDALFIDIETTGLSSQKHFIYCIGTAYRSGDQLSILQWIAENRSEETNVLNAFLQLLHKQHFKTILTFNGRTFDLPFIEKRCSLYALSPDLSRYNHEDLLAEIRPARRLLSMPHMRQKDLERFLGVSRDDQYDGGKLTDVYLTYEKCGDENLLHLLWLHNFEDMKGMYLLLPLLFYRRLMNGDFSVMDISFEAPDDTNACAVLTICYPFSLPRAVNHRTDNIHILLENTRGAIRIPLYCGTLRYYLRDYKNYYYLPGEDTVIHKSVGQFVDPEYRKPAAKENCFLKKTGCFLQGYTQDDLCCFKTDFTSRQFYIDLTEPAKSGQSIPANDLPSDLVKELHSLIVYHLNHC